jgi:hypothetical protein
MKRTLRDAFDRWKDALIDQDKQTTRAARHRALRQSTAPPKICIHYGASASGGKSVAAMSLRTKLVENLLLPQAPNAGGTRCLIGKVGDQWTTLFLHAAP